jgi:hypothetical protein
MAGVAAAAALPWLLGRAADDVREAIDNLRYGRTFKVRIQAASVLARMHDRRVVPELGRAARADRHPSVRIYVLRLLAHAPGGEADDEGARTAIKGALADRRAEVRREAQRALAALNQRRTAVAAPPTALPQEIVIAVRGVGDRTGRAGATEKAALRAAIIAQLKRERGVRVVEGNDPGINYAVDGSFARLDVTPAGTDVETTCAVVFVVSRPPRGIVLTVSGEATVIEPVSSMRGERRVRMQIDAIEHAVKSAHENLARFLASARR